MFALWAVRERAGQAKVIGNRRIDTRKLVIVSQVAGLVDRLPRWKQERAIGVIKLRRRAHEKPEPVFNNWSTNRDAGISVVKAVTRWIDVAQHRCAGSLNQRIGLKLRVAVVNFPGERLSCTESVRLELHPKVAVKLIAAALGDNVDHAASRAAKLSIETARLYLHFLYELERQVIGFA